MAVYTQVSDDALAGFLDAYDVGTAISFKGIAEGVENSNYFLETTTGRFILTLFEKRARPEDLPFFMALMEHLADAGFPAPRPVQARDGEALRRLEGKRAVLITFLTGVSPSRPGTVQCAALGRTMAMMHRTLDGTPLDRVNDLAPTDWTAMFAGREDEAGRLERGLPDRIAADLKLIEETWPGPGDLPRGIVHADLFPDNVFFIGDEVSGVIDFYFACTDHLAYDIAVALNAWCFEASGEYNFTKGAALLSGYEDVRRLVPSETTALPLLARGAAMRFFLTRLVDWSTTPADALVRPKDPLAFEARLAFHRQAGSAQDYGWKRL